MSRTNKARGLALAIFVVPLLLSTVVLAGTASANNKHPRPMSITCVTVDGTYGGAWELQGCSQPGTITGGASTSIAGNFSTSMKSFKVTWDLRTGASNHTTTMSVGVTPAPHNSCGKTNSEYEVLGLVSSDSVGSGHFVGVKVGSKVKFFVCKIGTSFSNTIKGKPRKARF